MAMYGWIASTPGFNDKIKNPQTLGLLQKFSYSEDTEAFKFELGDVVDSHNSEGSYDHTVWIEIYEKAGSKLGEISTEISDNSVGNLGSKYILLAACLEKLGFVDEDSMTTPEDAFEDTAQEPPLEALPDDDMQHSARMKAAVRILKAIASTGIELADPNFRKQDSEGWGADDTKAHQRESQQQQQSQSRQQQFYLSSAKSKLKRFYSSLLNTPAEGTSIPIAEYLRQTDGNWGALFNKPEFRRVAIQAKNKLQEFFTHSNLTQEEAEAFKNQTDTSLDTKANIVRLLEELPGASHQSKVASCISALDAFIKRGNTLNEDFEDKD